MTVCSLRLALRSEVDPQRRAVITATLARIESAASPRPDDGGHASMSDAERRVASLAANGQPCASRSARWSNT
jgi:hypothetical protein